MNRPKKKISACGTDLLEDLPRLNPGECVRVGKVTKTPLIVKVRPRITKEGGADVDVVSRLAESRRRVGAEARLRLEGMGSKPFTGELE